MHMYTSSSKTCIGTFTVREALKAAALRSHVWHTNTAVFLAQLNVEGPEEVRAEPRLRDVLNTDLLTFRGRSVLPVA